MEIPKEILEANERLKAQREKLGLTQETSQLTSKELKTVEALFPPDSPTRRMMAGEGQECPKCRRLILPEYMADHTADHAEDESRRAQEVQRRAKAAADKTEKITNGELSELLVGISLDHGSAKLEDFSASIAAGVLCEIDSEDFRGFLICGPAGTGKTRLMAAICRQLLLRNKLPHWYMSRDLLRRIWNTYRDKSDESEEQVIEELKTAQALCIDDLGHEGKVSDAAVGALHEVLSVRHDNHRATMITTNLSISEIAKVYDASIASRLGSWCPIVLAGKDRR